MRNTEPAQHKSLTRVQPFGKDFGGIFKEENTMAGLVVQHNLNAINANNKMVMNVSGTKKATEKLSSGYQINRAGDNAAGLAISEKMRSQIRGLSQATKNANDGISLIQTAEGGLNETHAILQRMRELAVQSANGTYQDETDREAIQLEVDALKSEIDRIASSTEYNGMKLLDGSLGTGGANNEFGAKFGIVSTTDDALKGSILTSNVVGVKVLIATDASGKGGENAIWDDEGKELTLNLAAGETYTQKQIDTLIENATQVKAATNAPAEITLTLANGVVTADTADTGATVAGLRATGTASLATIVGNGTSAGIGSSDTITFTANTYGTAVSTKMPSKITVNANVAAGKEGVTVTTAATDTAGAEVTLSLATGVEYTEADIEAILKEAGYDYDVKLTDTQNPDGSTDGKVLFNVAATEVEVTITDGAGVGKESVGSTGKGLTFQIGANGVEDQRVTLSVDDMSSSSIGVANADVSTQDAANRAIEMVDDAVKTVSMQRAGLGALQNRLEYTVNNLTTTNENLTAAESQIRDTDMATEMINYTKYNILQQASQAMLAQANQQPQAVLQLLQ